MQFQTPQFIDVESKIVSFLTLKQFLYVAAAGGLIFLLFFVIGSTSFFLWMFLSVILMGIGIALAFGKYNGVPLPRIILLAMGFFWKPRLYLWQQQVAMPYGLQESRSMRDFLSGMPNVKKLVLDLVATKGPLQREKSFFSGKRTKDKFEVMRKITGEKVVARRVDYR